ncbi:MAG: hypothetical protein ACM3MF_05265 [Anaerolineae bacterium]
MNGSHRQRWFLTALLIGTLYFLIGELFALPANNVRAWRLAAWLASAAAYAAHIGYEHFRLRNSPRAIAFHAATGVAIGAFGLALGATVHSWLVPSSTPFIRFLLALVLWPVITALPAFLAAYVVSVVLARLWRRA